ncbi:glycosyl transferase [Aerococcaceae bacterium NML210727]|nr:glycosyl transferase [Aerococcaceae bacterium NML210727]MCW6654801.1 glycosyl transferase [Aerococcaceae bacterium NML201296]
MKKIQIIEVTENNNHAGTKANSDVAQIALSSGYAPLELRARTTVENLLGKVYRQIGYILDWWNIYNQVENGSIVLLQHPFHTPQLTRNRALRALKNRKNIRIISMVHDVEQLRGYRNNSYYEHEFQVMMELADVIIVHNEIMKEFFIEQGYPEANLVVLEIFDYLVESELELLSKQNLWENSISIAGNLDSRKANYLSQLDNLLLHIHLYGPNYTLNGAECEKIQYHGSLRPEEVPLRLNRGFGLVWDGDSVHSCEGASGNYLRYNNPHKLSLYLASGLPVVIWKEAAEAKFVSEQGVGYTVDSLLELSNILEKVTSEDYQMLLGNVKTVQQKLIKGHYTTCALDLAEQRGNL